MTVTINSIWLAHRVVLVLTTTLTGCLVGCGSSAAETQLAAKQGKSARAIAFSSDSRYIASAYSGMTTNPAGADYHKAELCIFDRRDNRMIHSEITPHHISHLAFSPDVSMLAVIVGGQPEHRGTAYDTDGTPREIRVYSVPEFKLLWKEPRTHWVSSCAFSPDGKFLATVDASNGGPILIWDLQTKKEKSKIADIASPATVVRYSRDGKQLAINTTVVNIVKVPGQKAIGSRTPVIRLFDAATLKQIDDIPAFEIAPVNTTLGNVVNDFHFLGNDRIVTRQNFVATIDLRTKAAKRLADVDRQDQYLAKRQVTASPDGTLIAFSATRLQRTAAIYNKIFLWDAVKDQQHSVIEVGRTINGVHCLAISPDNKTLAIGYEKLHLFEIK